MLIRIGKIVNTQGLKGDVRIYPDTDYLQRFEELEYLYIDGVDEKFYIEKVRYKKNLAIIKFEGYDHINDIEKYKNKVVYTERESLEDGRFYVEDLIGLKVIDEKHGLIGHLKDVLQNPAHDIYVVKTDGEDLLIPNVSQFVDYVDMEDETIYVHLIEGFLS